MFSGIIEEVGSIHSIEKYNQGAKFHIHISPLLNDIKVGDSLSVNGCCLTIVKCNNKILTCDVVQETLNQTNLKYLEIGDKVNLERSIRYQERINGHLVQGHIDETGMISNKKALSDGSWWVTIIASPTIMRYVIYKGSIALDGVSLTIADLQENHFSFAMIPHTAQITILGLKQKNDLVNIEVDMMAKYAERFRFNRR